jgi:hypothetical protein
MTLIKPLAFFVLLSALDASAICQDSKTARQLDDFGRLNCEDILVKSEAFAQALNREPNKVGVVVVYGSDIDGKVANVLAGLIHRTVLGRLGFDVRVTVIRSHFEKPLEFQLWIADDASSVNVPQGKIVATIPFQIDKRFYFGGMSDDPCTNEISPAFAKVVNSKRRYIGQIVNFNVPVPKRAELAEQQIKEFSQKYNVPRRKLRIFFKREPVRNDPFWTNRTEFWISPN